MVGYRLEIIVASVSEPHTSVFIYIYVYSYSYIYIYICRTSFRISLTLRPIVQGMGVVLVATLE